MLKAVADGETDPAALAALAHERLRTTPEQLCDALSACKDFKPVYRRLLKMALEQLQFLEQQIGQLESRAYRELSQARRGLPRSPNLISSASPANSPVTKNSAL